MEVLGIILALVGLGVAALATRRAGAVSRELQQVRGQQYERYYQLVGKLEDLETEVRQLRIQARQAAGDLRFTPDMTFAEAMTLHPEVQAVLAGYHIGGCSSCAVDPEDTIADGAMQANVPVNELIGALNGLLNRERVITAPRAQSGLLQIELEMPAHAH